MFFLYLMLVSGARKAVPGKAALQRPRSSPVIRQVYAVFIRPKTGERDESRYRVLLPLVRREPNCVLLERLFGTSTGKPVVAAGATLRGGRAAWDFALCLGCAVLAAWRGLALGLGLAVASASVVSRLPL